MKRTANILKTSFILLCLRLQPTLAYAIELLYIVLCANLCVAQYTTHTLYRYSKHCNCDAQSWNIKHFLYMIFAKVKIKSSQYSLTLFSLPHLLQFHHLYINHIQSLIHTYTHLYNIYTYNNIVLCAYIISYVCCANLLVC